MGFFDRGQGKGIPRNATFRLTQSGQEKVKEFSGDPKSRILVALETEGTMNVDEISNTSGMSKGQVERLLPVILRGGYIQYISASTVESE